MDDFDWSCPHCERAVTISPLRQSVKYHDLEIKNNSGMHRFVSRFLVCPNAACRKFTLEVALYTLTLEDHPHSGTVSKSFGDRVSEWALIPPSTAKHFPDYVPEVIRQDYEEACLIRNLSPKSSATLSRRCLQGILRDFWKVKPARLKDEIDQIKTKIDPGTWEAISAVRKLGNIGAHMENDINVIIDVEPDEAKILIELVETLLAEWYVAREQRKERMAAVLSVAKEKNEMKIAKGDKRKN